MTLLVLVGIVMSLSGRMGGGTAAAKRMGLSREGLEAWLSSLGQGALGLALLLAAAFPLVTRSVQGPLREAHAGEGYAWLAVFMQGRETLPDAYYLLAARRYLLGVLVAGLSVGVSLWILGRARHLTRRVRSGVSTLRHRPGVRRGLFFAGWLLVVYLFHAFTTTTVSGHGRKRIILGLVGYTGLLAVLVRRAPGVLGSWLIPSWDPSRVRGRSRSLESLTVMVALMLVLGIAVASPLTSGDRRFRQPQRMYRLLYAQLERQFVRLPERAELEVRGIPQWAGWRERPPKYPLMSGSLLRLNFPAWLKLRFPDKGFVVRRRESARLLGGCPCHTWVERQQVGSHVFVFQAHWHQQGRSDREPDRAEKRGERSAKR